MHPDLSANTVEPVELTVLMPCLNEAETLAPASTRRSGFLRAAGIAGEVLIADNGSTDGSQQIAEAAGARVVDVPTRGYGAALHGRHRGGARPLRHHGRRRRQLRLRRRSTPFVEQLRDGADLVMGNRFQGGIAPGAMPLLHRYLGNPVLCFLGRLFFRIPIGDFHCGLRGFARDAILGARTCAPPAWSSPARWWSRPRSRGLRIAEVPTTLCARRPRRAAAPAHLARRLAPPALPADVQPALAVSLSRPVSAGVRLFTAFRCAGAVKVGNVEFDIHTFVVACISVLVGIQALSFGAVARRFATVNRMLPPSRAFSGILAAFTLERVLAAAVIIALCGVAGVIACVAQWASTDFGPLEYTKLLLS